MKRLFCMLAGVFLFALLSSCNLPTVPTEPPAPTLTELPTSVPIPVTAATQPATMAPTEPPPRPTDTPPPEIIHVMKPRFGDGKAQTIHDQVSENTAPEKRAYGGDEYALGRYERPFTAEEMEYLPFIDLVRADLYRDEDDLWAYATLEVVAAPALAGDQRLIYGLELDSDLDGRGDALILAALPPDDRWTTQGVQIWLDVNSSVGAQEPMKPDEGAAADGYEVLLFDEGQGQDADAAWVRLSSESDKQIELAFKLDLVDIGEEYRFFLWGAWAFAGEAHPDWFDHHDTFSLAEMGSPLKDNDAYPLQAFAMADNTCRALSGMEPTGQLPGMCPYTPPKNTHTTGGCTPVNCCPLATVGCNAVWDPRSCQCVPIN